MIFQKKTFDSQFEELVLAVALCDYESAKSILSSEWYEKNMVKIMHKGRNVGLIDNILRIHDIPACWATILNPDVIKVLAPTVDEAVIESVRNEVEKITDLLSQKFSGRNDWSRYIDSVDSREYLDEYNPVGLRDIDDDLVQAFGAFDFDEFESNLRYGANPWANIGGRNRTSVGQMIMEGCASALERVLPDITNPDKKINLKELLNLLIKADIYMSFFTILKEKGFVDGEEQKAPIKTVPRIIYDYHKALSMESVSLELWYDPDTDDAHLNDRPDRFWGSKVSIPAHVIKQLLSPESIEQFMNLVFDSELDYFICDGCSYTIKMIDAMGNARKLHCNDHTKNQVPHIAIIEKYTKSS